MAAFASKTPRALIRTPEDDALIAAGDIREEEVYGLIPAKFHNDPNPILVSIREQGWEELTARGKANDLAEWIWWLSDESHNIYLFKRREHIEHAREVLTRLARLIDTDEELSSFEKNRASIESAIRLGISAEDDGEPVNGVYEYDDAGDPMFNPLGRVVRSFTEDQITWLASWLATENIGKIR